MLSLLHFVADQLSQLTAMKQLLGLQVLHLPLDPPSGSLTPGPGICAAFHDEEPQLPRNSFMTKVRGSKMEMGLSLISSGSSSCSGFQHARHLLFITASPGDLSSSIRCRDDILTETASPKSKIQNCVSQFPLTNIYCTQACIYAWFCFFS